MKSWIRQCDRVRETKFTAHLLPPSKLLPISTNSSQLATSVHPRASGAKFESDGATRGSRDPTEEKRLVEGAPAPSAHRCAHFARAFRGPGRGASLSFEGGKGGASSIGRPDFGGHHRSMSCDVQAIAVRDQTLRQLVNGHSWLGGLDGCRHLDPPRCVFAHLRNAQCI